MLKAMTMFEVAVGRQTIFNDCALLEPSISVKNMDCPAEMRLGVTATLPLYSASTYRGVVIFLFLLDLRTPLRPERVIGSVQGASISLGGDPLD
jgi:hypothetical protein